jgi:peptidoglycan L-alanyl-D-glutamate endopeptidase CwlK
MSQEYFTRIEFDDLYPPFAEKLLQLVEACEAQGAIYIATSGVRTYQEQNELYAKGRTAPGGIVTNARGGYSPHNFHIAVDFCRHSGTSWSGKLSPNYKDSAYTILGQEAAKLGLEWGGAWTSIKDTPHIQLPIKSQGLSWSILRSWYDEGGIQNVFSELDKYSW